MSTRKIVSVLACIVFYCVPGYAQRKGYGPYHGELLGLSQAMKNARNLSYAYSFDADFPNGQHDKLSGKMYMGSDDRVLLNDNDAFTMLYNDTWFYKADHREKTVTIVNVGKHLNKDYKAALESDVFQNGSLTIYLDSIICKYGTIQHIRRDGDTVSMELGFPQQVPIRSIEMVYNEKAKMMIGYVIKTFQAYRSFDLQKNKGTTKIIRCSNFKHIDNSKVYKTDNLFKITGDRVILKKYKKYKLNTKL